MKAIDRRKFLRTGITGAGMVALSPVISKAGSSNQERKLIYRTLGRTGLKLPVISFGVMRSDNASLCKAAHEQGIVYFDTAHGYQGGNNETMLGNLFRNVPRNSFVIGTKVKSERASDGRPNSRTTPEDLLQKFNLSLSRLKMDYVDILYVHDVSAPELIEYKPIIETVRSLKKQGKVKFIGFSTHSNEIEVIKASLNSDIWDVILTRYNFQMENLDELNSVIKKAAAKGTGIVGMKTIAGGGFLDKERTKPLNTTAAIKWVLSNPDIHTIIPGMTNFDHLTANMKIFDDLALSDAERKDLIAATLQPGLSCSGCSECLSSCTVKAPVPDLMRAYMYAYGYQNASMAKELLNELKISGNPCLDCTDCNVSCHRNFNLKEKITDIYRLADVPAGFLS